MTTVARRVQLKVMSSGHGQLRRGAVALALFCPCGREPKEPSCIPGEGFTTVDGQNPA